MKIVCAGGGPGGLYFSILMKLQDPAHEITVHERNPAGSTYGWGVTYWEELLDRLRAHDEPSAHALHAASLPWKNGRARIREQVTEHHGDQGYGIGRHRLLALLAARARDLGVDVRHGSAIDPAAPPAADLLVAADGVGSTLRRHHAHHFGPRLTEGRNVYVWLGTPKVFTSFSFAFVDTPHGWIWCYAYGYGPEGSTCVIECAPATWRGLGLDTAKEDVQLRTLEGLFAGLLDGAPLLGQDATHPAPDWRPFRTLTTRRWHHDNLVLLGDAAHTTHYSIGAGTTLALEDAMALADALGEGGPREAAFAAYERRRRRELLAVQSAARHSAQWYENLPRYIDLPPEQMFALLGQRHSPLLPYVPPQLYYRVDRAAERLEALRRLKRWLGPRLARGLQSRDTERR
ncbi:FAD-dependent monooxygenase [Streptomyces sp. NPDC058426]|uniref:FAD-dependent monooxygenase n=1 Tax=Streptomyces sp. NPDC058426 TaxID=3346493 RepID=UPI003665B310